MPSIHGGSITCICPLTPAVHNIHWQSSSQVRLKHICDDTDDLDIDMDVDIIVAQSACNKDGSVAST